MWSSPFLKGLFIALLSLPLLLSAFLPIPPPDIPYLTHDATPLPKHPNEVTRGYESYFWVSDAEILFRDDKKPGMHPKVWNWRTGNISALPGYMPPANSTRYLWGFWPSPDGRYLLFTENERSRKKSYREWLYAQDLRLTPNQPGFLTHIPIESVIQPGWFPDSRRFVNHQFIRSRHSPTTPVKISVRDIAGRARADEVRLPTLKKGTEAIGLLGITPDSNAIHFVFNHYRSDGGGRLVHTPLDDSARQASEYPTVPPRSLATIGFRPVHNSVCRNEMGQDLLLWVEQRTFHPFHYLGHQINEIVSNLRVRGFRYFQVEQYSVLWVSNADGTGFRPIGRTPPDTDLAGEHWLPNGRQIAIRLRKHNPNKTTTERFYFRSVE